MDEQHIPPWDYRATQGARSNWLAYKSLNDALNLYGRPDKETEAHKPLSNKKVEGSPSEGVLEGSDEFLREIKCPVGIPIETKPRATSHADTSLIAKDKANQKEDIVRPL
jgi:hypothetical protein